MKWIALALLAVALTLPLHAESPALKLTDGDRVLFVGPTVVERDSQYGYFETLLNARFPAANFTFRNFGWSGDTVWGEARAEFGTPKDGYKRLVDEVSEAKPTVLLLAYGVNESFEGEAGLGRFIEQYGVLLDDLGKTGARVWLIGPGRLEDLGSPLPDPAEHNKQVKVYSDAIRALAAKRGCGFVDLFEVLPDGAKVTPPRPLTDDGMHYNAYGAWRFGLAMETSLIAEHRIGRTLAGDPAARLEAIRLKTIAKNREHFYRWRPQNDTYIFGFRKHEQGRNAVEIPQFDTIIGKIEAEIMEMKKALDGATVPAMPEK